MLIKKKKKNKSGCAGDMLQLLSAVRTVVLIWLRFQGMLATRRWRPVLP